MTLTLPNGTYRLVEEPDGYHWDGAIPECSLCHDSLVRRPGSRYARITYVGGEPENVLCNCGAEYPLTVAWQS